ncbi:hypothetical protein [Bacillus sp. AK128]
MINNLPNGVKISLTRSITTAFEQYMKSIQWSKEAYNLEKFVTEWNEYASNNAAWYNKIDGQLKADPQFHQDLANKINETIEKILTEEPTQEQMDELEMLIRDLEIADIDYSCKAEAKYHIDRLKKS